MTVVEICGVQKHFKAEHDLWKTKLCQHKPVFCNMNVMVLVQDHKTATFPQTNVFCVSKTDGWPSKGSSKADWAVRSNHGNLVGRWNHFGTKAVFMCLTICLGMKFRVEMFLHMRIAYILICAWILKASLWWLRSDQWTAPLWDENRVLVAAPPQ